MKNVFIPTLANANDQVHDAGKNLVYLKRIGDQLPKKSAKLKSVNLSLNEIE